MAAAVHVYYAGMASSGYSDGELAARAADLPFDMRSAAGAEVSDLDVGLIERQYLPDAVPPDVLAGNRRTLSEQMRSLRLVGEEAPTNGALLAFGRDPQRWLPGAWVQFTRFHGDGITDPIRTSESLTGQLGDVLGGIGRLLRLNIETRLEVMSGPRENRFPDYPVEALRQLVYNAVMHRVYEGTNAPLRLRWFARGVLIESPGGLFGRVTPENLLDGVTDYRNPLIAEIMRNSGFAQRFGVGIPLARRALADNGNPPPEFDADGSRVRVTVRSAR